MKKLLAILLALMMVLVSVAALADENDSKKEDTTPVVSVDATKVNTAGVPTEKADVTIRKVITPGRETDTHPALTLKFTVGTGIGTLSTVTTAPAVEIPDLSIAEGAGSADLTIKLPSYSAVGVYTYPITEEATNIAGMTEAQNLELKITVIQNGENLQVAGIALRQDNVKVDKITNLYKAGTLTVTKTVAGNMGDRTKAFPITITLTAPTGKTVASTVTYAIGEGTASNATFNEDGVATIKVNLKHGETVTINNIPEGVTYTAVEDTTIKHLTAADEEQTNANAYLVEGEVTNATSITANVVTAKTIKNTKTIDVDTGVTLDSTVYMLIMALALAGIVVLKIRRREDY